MIPVISYVPMGYDHDQDNGKLAMPFLLFVDSNKGKGAGAGTRNEVLRLRIPPSTPRDADADADADADGGEVRDSTGSFTGCRANSACKFGEVISSMKRN